MNKHAMIAIAALAIAAFAPSALAQNNELASTPIETFDRWNEIQDLAWPLQVAAGDTCRDSGHFSGVELLATPGQGLFVRHVIKGSPAHGIVFQEDRVISLNGKAFHKDFNKAYEQWIERKQAIEGKSLEQVFVVEREGAQLSLMVKPTLACNVEIVYLDKVPFSVKDENRIVLSKQLDDIAPEAWMVQAQLAHDIAHYVGEHQETRKRFSKFSNMAGNITSMVSGVDVGRGSGIFGGLLFGKKHEIEADRVALDLAIKIGLDPSDVVGYWVELINEGSTKFPGSKFLSLHPPHPDRVTALEALLESFADNEQAGSIEPSAI